MQLIEHEGDQAAPPIYSAICVNPVSGERQEPGIEEHRVECATVQLRTDAAANP
jgi:hypothetical protein